MNTFTYLFLAALAVSVLLRLWLAGRQIAHVGKYRGQVPETFASHIPLEDHRKAADYTRVNTRIGMLALLWDSLILLAWTLGGGLEWLDKAWRGADLAPV
ncbi:MAG: M48 family peptidase, partial [Gammaproteobacteria bacterium]